MFTRTRSKIRRSARPHIRILPVANLYCILDSDLNLLIYLWSKRRKSLYCVKRSQLPETNAKANSINILSWRNRNCEPLPQYNYNNNSSWSSDYYQSQLELATVHCCVLFCFTRNGNVETTLPTISHHHKPESIIRFTCCLHRVESRAVGGVTQKK